MVEPMVDAEAFNAFEAAGWEKQVAGYEDFFGPIRTRLVEPLLDAAEVGRGARALDVASGPRLRGRQGRRTRRVGHRGGSRRRDDLARTSAPSAA